MVVLRGILGYFDNNLYTHPNIGPERRNLDATSGSRSLEQGYMAIERLGNNLINANVNAIFLLQLQFIITFYHKHIFQAHWANLKAP
jgi:hypothetical protein